MSLSCQCEAIPLNYKVTEYEVLPFAPSTVVMDGWESQQISGHDCTVLTDGQGQYLPHLPSGYKNVYACVCVQPEHLNGATGSMFMLLCFYYSSAVRLTSFRSRMNHSNLARNLAKLSLLFRWYHKSSRWIICIRVVVTCIMNITSHNIPGQEKQRTNALRIWVALISENTPR